MERMTQSATKRTRTAPVAAISGSSRGTANDAGVELPDDSFDARSIGTAAMAAAGFCALIILSLSLSRFDLVAAPVWLPNAFAVAVLLTARLRRELPFYIGIAFVALAANIANGTVLTGTINTLAALADIAAVTWLTRRLCGSHPDMTDPGQVVRFALIGGAIGPGLFALIASSPGWSDPNAHGPGLSGWFLADSAAMLLLVPAVLVSFASRSGRGDVGTTGFRQKAAITLAGMIATVCVFSQNSHALLLLAPAITMLVACTTGPIATALYIPGIVTVAAAMTYSGNGPIFANAAATGQHTTLFIQAFALVNSLTGLTVAAIVHGSARITAELRRKSDELKRLSLSMKDAVLSLDRQGMCIYASPSAREIIGRDPASVIGRPLVDIVHEDDRQRITGMLDRVKKGKSGKETLTCRRLLEDERGFPVFVEADCAADVDPVTGTCIGVALSVRIATTRVELERSLAHAQRKADHSARERSEFLGYIGHRIRPSIDTILGLTETMSRGEERGDQNHSAEMIVQSAQSARTVLDDVDELAKIESGTATIQSAPVDLAAIVSECAELHRSTAKTKGLGFRINPMRCPRDRRPELREVVSAPVDRGTRPIVLADALRVRQILLNLIGNAVKYTERGQIEIRYWAAENEFGVEVRDSGIGIDRSRIDTIFSPFKHVDTGTSHRFAGTGLGLAISHRLATFLGGSLEVESSPGEGSCFRVFVPTAYVAGQNGDSPCDEIEEIEAPDLPQSARVLLVEDQETVRRVGAQMLERCGQNVALAHDGTEAIAMVIDAMMRDEPYDLILMTTRLPGCDGHAVTRAIRAEGIDAMALPVIALIADPTSEDITSARDAGMQAHLATPLVFEDLARALSRWLPTRIIETAPWGGFIGPLEEKPASGNSPRPAPRRNSAAKPGHWEFGDNPAAGSNPKSERSPTPDRRDELRGLQGCGAAGTDMHSVALTGESWMERRSQALEAVEDALANGALFKEAEGLDQRKALALALHKLADIAAGFGEPELGDQAARLQRALFNAKPGAQCETLAFDLLSIADNPVDRRACAR